MRQPYRHVVVFFICDFCCYIDTLLAWRAYTNKPFSLCPKQLYFFRIYCYIGLQYLFFSEMPIIPPFSPPNTSKWASKRYFLACAHITSQAKPHKKTRNISFLVSLFNLPYYRPYACPCIHFFIRCRECFILNFECV